MSFGYYLCLESLTIVCCCGVKLHISFDCLLNPLETSLKVIAMISTMEHIINPFVA